MELLINTKEFDIYSTNVPKEVVGYQFYSLKGEDLGFYKSGEKKYPKSNYKIIVTLNGKLEILNYTDKLYKTENNKYLIDDSYSQRFKKTK